MMTPDRFKKLITGYNVNELVKLSEILDTAIDKKMDDINVFPKYTDMMRESSERIPV
jgi:hypothetical protein